MKIFAKMSLKKLRIKFSMSFNLRKLQIIKGVFSFEIKVIEYVLLNFEEVGYFT